jgi:anti-anti-sigma factor
MSLSPHPRSPDKEPPSPAVIRFECSCKLDSRGSAFLELSGELDGAVCREFEARLAEAMRASATVTLDLRRLIFMDSAGYAVLVRAARASKPEARLILAGCGEQVGRLLSLVGLPEQVEMQAAPIPSAAGAVADPSAASPGSGAAVGA